MSSNGRLITEAMQNSQLAKAQGGLTIPKPVPVYDNIVTPGKMRQQAIMSQKAKQLAALKASQQNRAEVRPAGPKRSAMSKALAIAANPMTAASYVVKGQDIPENFERGSVNAYDVAGSLLNPFSVIDAASKTPESFRQGDYLGAAMNMADIIPGVVTVPKSARAALNQIDRLSPVGRRLDAVKREGRAAGLNDFEIAQRQMNEVGITSNQRQGYVPGVSELARKYITPYGYTGMGSGSKLKEIIENIKKGGVSYYGDELVQPISDARTDAWNMYLGFPQRYNTFRMAETAPVNHRAYNKKQLKNMDLYSLNDEARIADELGRGAHSTTPAGVKDAIDNLKAESFVEVDPVDVMGNFNARFTNDGVQYNDIWDLDPSIAPVNFMPYKVKEFLHDSPLFYKKTFYPGVKHPMYSPRRMNINVSRFLGKPYMSHGNIENMSAKKYRDTLLENLKKHVAFYTRDAESASIYAPKIEMLKDQIKEVDQIDRFRKNGGMIIDPRGQWAHPGKETMVPTPTGQITMQGVSYPVYGQDETGYGQMMYPGGEYQFPGQMVYETPMMQKGGRAPIYVDNPRDPKLVAYNDSLRLYNKYKKDLGDRGSNSLEQSFKTNDPLISDLLKHYGIDKSKVKPTRIDQYNSGYSGTGTAFIPVYKKPVQPVKFKKPEPSYIEKFGLTNEDVKRAFTTKPVNNKGDVYYTIDKGGKKFKIHTQSGGLDYIEEVPKPKPQSRRQELVMEFQPMRQQAPATVPYQAPVRQYTGSPVYSPGAGSGMPSALVGFRSDKGDITYIQPEDYERFAVPAYAKQYIESQQFGDGGQHGGLDRWFAEKWVDVKTGKACGRQEGEKRRSYPACRPSRRVSEDTPKTASELSSSEREKFKRSKTSSERINYQHRRKEDGGETNETDMANKPNNPALWSRAKSLAKQKFDVYPSAYANGWAAKWYKGKGGTWSKAMYGMEMMEDGGAPDNEGFRALPPAVQQKIMDNMAAGGEKMPPEIARARFAAAGNTDKLDDYGYAYGGYMPEMMAYGGAAQQAAIAIAMKKAGKKPKMMGDGGEPNGEMALGQMASVQDKMNKLLQFVRPDDNLDPWIASKLAVMDHSADAIADYMMYGPEAQEMAEEMEMMKNGGYTVTRSNDRKGKTHKVTGPDGTVKYFGDSKLGQHPKDPERKKAFYARHKKNLANNPYFRAFARETWAEGGYVGQDGKRHMSTTPTWSGNAGYEMGGYIPEFMGGGYCYECGGSVYKDGGIHIDPKNKGKFTASANEHGMGVQEFAAQVLQNPDAYSSTMVKRANFARNAANWKKADGGPVVGEVMDVTPEQLEILRQQGYQFEII